MFALAEGLTSESKVLGVFKDSFLEVTGGKRLGSSRYNTIKGNATSKQAVVD